MSSEKVFSFCLYGTAPKYVQGMHENVRDISRIFPDWKVFIYHKDVDIEPFRVYDNVVLVEGRYSGNQLRLDRFRPIDQPGVSIMIVRDADSRINKRDEWCILDFIASPKLFHIIRDHPYHTVPILAGMWGIKKGCIPHFSFSRSTSIYMGSSIRSRENQLDQYFLADVIYPKIVNRVLIHGSVSMLQSESVTPIPFKHNGMFCGQVIEYSEDGSTYVNPKDCDALN